MSKFVCLPLSTAALVLLGCFSMAHAQNKILDMGSGKTQANPEAYYQQMSDKLQSWRANMPKGAVVVTTNAILERSSTGGDLPGFIVRKVKGNQVTVIGQHDNYCTEVISYWVDRETGERSVKDCAQYRDNPEGYITLSKNDLLPLYWTNNTQPAYSLSDSSKIDQYQQYKRYNGELIPLRYTEAKQIPVDSHLVRGYNPSAINEARHDPGASARRMKELFQIKVE